VFCFCFIYVAFILPCDFSIYYRVTVVVIVLHVVWKFCVCQC